MFIAICESSTIENSEVAHALEKTSCVKNIIFFNDPLKLLASLKVNRFDLVLLDTRLPRLNGIETARAVRQIDPDVSIVFVSAHADFCFEAFSVYATDYILKPLCTDRLERTIRKIYAQVRDDNKRVVEIKTQNAVYRVKQSDIVLIEKVLNRCIVYTEKLTIDVIMPLKHFEDVLDKELFIRSHAGYLVNRERISRIDVNGNLSYTIHFDGIKKTALVSRSKKNKLFEYISNVKAVAGC